MSGLDLAVPGPTGLRVPRDSPLGWPCWGGSRNGAQGISKGHLHPPTQCAPPWGGSLALLLQGPGFSSCPRYCWHPTLCSPRPAGESKLLNKGPPMPFRKEGCPPRVCLCPALPGSEWLELGSRAHACLAHFHPGSVQGHCGRACSGPGWRGARPSWVRPPAPWELPK